MAGLGLMNRRRTIASFPVKSEMGAILEGRIGWYTFVGRSNDDADRGIVADRSGRGLPMEVSFTSWGLGDAYTKNGYYDDCLCTAGAKKADALIKIPLEKPLGDSFTIILERAYYNNSGLTQWAAQLGSTAVGNANNSPIYMDYADTSLSDISTSYRGGTLYRGRVSDEIIWMTPESYCGLVDSAFSPKNSNDAQELYLAMLRPNINTVQRTKIRSVHIFNKTLTPMQVKTYIRAFINSSYILPE